MDMENISPENQAVKPKITQDSKVLFEQSKKAALACLARYPNAKIVFRGKSKKEKLKWKSPQYHLSKLEIQASQPGLFAVILDSIKACAIDFDIKGPSHPDGGDPRVLKQTAQEWGLENYPFTQTSPSGGWQTIHCNPPTGQKSGASKFGKGIDYKAGPNLLMLYDPALWTHDLKTLPRALPTLATQAMEAIQRAKAKEKLNGQQPKAGHGHTNTLLNSGFGIYKHAKIPAKVGQKAREIVLAYHKNPGNTSQAEADIKLGTSLIEGITGNKVFNKFAEIPHKTKNPEIDLENIPYIHNIIPQGFFIPVTGETGTGKSNLCCCIGAMELLKDTERQLYIYSQESDWNHNIVPYFLSAGMTMQQIKKQVIFKDCTDYQAEELQVLYDINTLKSGDFVIIEPSRILTKNPNNSTEVTKVIKEYQSIAQKKQLFMLALHHTTTGWAGATIKEQIKFCKEWLSASRHALILKEKEKDGECILFVQKSNLMERKGFIEFKIVSQDIEVNKDFTLKNKPAITDINHDADMKTKDILQKYFKHEGGLEKPKRTKATTEQLKSLIVKIIKKKITPEKDFVTKKELVKSLEKQPFSEGQIAHRIKDLKKDDIISIETGDNNESEYRLVNPENKNLSTPPKKNSPQQAWRWP